MREQRSTRLESTIELGQTVVTSLLREPVKQSIKEALEEERITAVKSMDEKHSDESTTGTGSGGGRRRFLRPRILIPLLGLAATVAIAIRRGRSIGEVREEVGLGDEAELGLGGSTGDDDTTTTPTYDGGAPSGSESAGSTDADGDEEGEEDPDQGETLHQ